MIPYFIFLFMLISLSFLIYTKYNKPGIFSIMLKTITSLLFISICISSQIIYGGNTTYFFYILIALIFSLLGDIFLAFPINISNGSNSAFIKGLLNFSLAHIFFSIGFITLVALSPKDIIIFLTFALISFLILKLIRGFSFNGMFPFVILYSSIISLMLAKSVSTLRLININPKGVLLIFCGSLLFFTSDIILSFIYFYKKPAKPLVAINLITYYTGQGLIALSVMCF